MFLLYIYAPIGFYYLTIAVLPFVIASAVYPLKDSAQPKWTKSFATWVVSHAKRYFKLKVIMKDEDALFADKRPLLFSMEPHDVLPISIFWPIAGAFRNRQARGAMTSAIFAVPIIKHVYVWMSACDAAKGNLMRLMKEGMSINICPGGVREVLYLGDRAKKTLFLKKRLGFTKLAMASGARIVPTFIFGQDKLYDYYISKNSFLVSIGRKLGFAPIIFFGVGGLPMGPPKSSPITVIVGKPIDVPHTDNPTQEELQKYHQLFIDETVRLYEDHKDKYDMKDVLLVIE